MDPLVSWLKQTLLEQGKTNRELARVLSVDPASVTALFRDGDKKKWKRRVQLDEWFTIFDWLGAWPPEELFPRVGRLRTVPVKGAVMERFWRDATVDGDGHHVSGLMGSDYPIEVQYALEVVDDPARPTGIAREDVICVDIALLQRPLRKNDLLHCELHDAGKVKTVLRRVSGLTEAGVLVHKRDGSGPDEPLASYTVLGLVIGRTEQFFR